MLLLRIQPYTTLTDFYVHRGEFIVLFDDFGVVKDTVIPDFLMSRMMLSAGVLLTTENGIVGIRAYKLSNAGKFFYQNRRICTQKKKIVNALTPIIEEAISGTA